MIILIVYIYVLYDNKIKFMSYKTYHCTLNFVSLIWLIGFQYNYPFFETPLTLICYATVKKKPFNKI